MASLRLVTQIFELLSLFLAFSNLGLNFAWGEGPRTCSTATAPLVNQAFSQRPLNLSDRMRFRLNWVGGKTVTLNRKNSSYKGKYLAISLLIPWGRPAEADSDSRANPSNPVIPGAAHWRKQSHAAYESQGYLKVFKIPLYLTLFNPNTHEASVEVSELTGFIEPVFKLVVTIKSREEPLEQPIVLAYHIHRTFVGSNQ